MGGLHVCATYCDELFERQEWLVQTAVWLDCWVFLSTCLNIVRVSMKNLGAFAKRMFRKSWQDDPSGAVLVQSCCASWGDEVYWAKNSAIRQCRGRQALLLSGQGAELLTVHEKANLHSYPIDYDPEEFDLEGAWESPLCTWVAISLRNKKSGTNDLCVMHIGENLVSQLQLQIAFSGTRRASQWVNDNAFVT